MLILSRKIGEIIRIGDDIEVMVAGFSGNQVRLGVNAPKSIPVYREEIYKKVNAESEGAEKQSFEE